MASTAPIKKTDDIRRGRGRPKGSVNKLTADIKALAQVHTSKAMKELARIATESESDQARVAAIKEIFDRGYGKASQILGSDPANPLPTGMTVTLVKTVE